MKKKPAIVSAKRVLVPFNTGTRTMKTEKHPSRAKAKRDARKEIRNARLLP